MNDERKTIARQYVHDMVRSFVKDAEGLTMTSIYAPDIERLLEIACDCDNYATKHKELNPFVLFGREIHEIDEVYVSLEPTNDHSSSTFTLCWFP